MPEPRASLGKRILFRLHWLAGLTAGLVLAMVGLTGALLSFEGEIGTLLNAPAQSNGAAGVQLAPPAMLSRVIAAHPGRQVLALEISDAPRVGFAPGAMPARSSAPPGKRMEWVFVDAATGALLGERRGEAFFRTTRELHRYLLSGDVGKQIVGASTVTLLVLALSGLWLRWPRTHTWRAWLRIDSRLGGRAFLWRLHAVLGTLVLPCYLLAALTGLSWSYEWYRAALFGALGAPVPQRPAGAGAPAVHAGTAPDPALVLERLWPAIAMETGAARSITIMFPDAAGKPLEVRHRGPDAPHERATDRLVFDVASGELRTREAYATKPTGARLAASIFELHRGSFFGIAGTVLIMLASALMPLFAVTGLLMYIERRRAARRDTSQAWPAPSEEPAA
jgi:sulfite reductase (NADPH) flavoprotein alpha-component